MPNQTFAQIANAMRFVAPAEPDYQVITVPDYSAPEWRAMCSHEVSPAMTVVRLRFDNDAMRYAGQCPDCGKRWYGVTKD